MNSFEYINSLSLFGDEDGYQPGLVRIKKLLEYLSNPHSDLNCIHIAGTNGKGSTAAILEKIYREAGYKTALYTSPHIFHFNERIKVNGRPCSTYELQELIPEVKKAAEKVKADLKQMPSFFEIVTALAFKYFKQHQAEIVILETGLGGRLDATNIIDSPLISIITNISLEHSRYLGETEAKIALEKAGIIKKDSKVITAAQKENVLEVLKKEAVRKNSKFINLNNEYLKIESNNNLKQNIITLKMKNNEEQKYKSSLLGKHQATNTALALRTTAELQSEFPVTKKAVKKALTTVYWPGRMEKISSDPTIILDGAHNPASFQALRENLNAYQDQYNKIHFIFSLLKDKKIDEILSELLKLEKDLQFYLAENNSFRTIKRQALKESFEVTKLDYQLLESIQTASHLAQKNAAPNDLIIAAGSFNVVFEAGIEFFLTLKRGEKYE